MVGVAYSFTHPTILVILARLRRSDCTLYEIEADLSRDGTRLALAWMQSRGLVVITGRQPTGKRGASANLFGLTAAGLC